MQYAVYQKPDALLLLYVTVQLPTQDDLVTQFDQQFAWCQLHKHLHSMRKPAMESHMLELGIAGAKTQAVEHTSWRLRCSGS